MVSGQGEGMDAKFLRGTWLGIKSQGEDRTWLHKGQRKITWLDVNGKEDVL